MATGYDLRPWEALYPERLAQPVSSSTAFALWEGAQARGPDLPAIHSGDETLTWRDVESRANALASSLVDEGLSKSERVGILLQNDPEWPISLLAAWKAGAIAVPLNPMFKERELLHHLDDSGCRVLICSETLFKDTAADVLAASTVRHVVMVEDGGDGSLPNVKARLDAFTELLDRDPGGSFAAAPRVGDVAILTYTSGTTGTPKGAMNTHGNIGYNAALAANWYDLGPEDVILGVAPLFHITGIVLHMALSWATGAPLVLFHRFDPTEALRLTESHRATFTVGSITVFIALLEHPDFSDYDLSSLAKLASGGAPISQATLDRFDRAMGSYIHNVYGLTETTSPSHAVPLGLRSPVDSSGSVSVGIPVPGCVARVVDLESGVEVPVGEIGEILIEGPMVVPGYWQMPEETRLAIPDGRLHTGDVGYMDDDGWFYVVDRAKDQINASGFKIWPREVESVLYEHPAVREAAVVGAPDPYRGETVHAFVSLNKGLSVTSEELVRFCKERLAAYKYPRRIELMDELPKTPTGKHLRRALRQLAVGERR